MNIVMGAETEILRRVVRKGLSEQGTFGNSDRREPAMGI